MAVYAVIECDRIGKQHLCPNCRKKKTYPDNAENWFIFNMAYDESKLVNYDEIIRKIQ